MEQEKKQPEQQQQEQQQNDNQEKKEQKKEKKTGIVAYALVPFVLAVPPIVGWAIGSFLDDFFETTPYLMYTFLVLGFVAAYREFFRLLRDFGE